MKQMRWEDLPASWGGPAPGRVNPHLDVPPSLVAGRPAAEQAESGTRVRVALDYENASYFLLEVPLPNVLKWRYLRGRIRAGLPTRVGGWLVDPSKVRGAGGHMGMRTPPLTDYPEAEQDRDGAALRELTAPVFLRDCGCRGIEHSPVTCARWYEQFPGSEIGMEHYIEAEV